MVTHVCLLTCGESSDLAQEKPVKTRGSRHWCITELMRHGQPVTADTRMCLMLPPYYSGGLPLALVVAAVQLVRWELAGQFKSVVLKS